MFSRATSYRPVWRTENTVQGVPHLSNIAGNCEAQGRFDLLNTYAFARVLSESDDTIRVGWRYFPDLNTLDPQGVVHEIYTIRSDGTITRSHRAGTATITAWNDPGNRTLQTIRVSPQGLEVVETTPPTPSSAPAPVTGAPILEPASVPVAMALPMDEGQGTATGDINATITGQGAPWRMGVSGRALAFDGYTSSVTVSAADTPPIEGSFTLMGWVALGARPWSDAPIVVIGEQGPFLGVDAYGHPLARSGEELVRGPQPLSLSVWTQLAATHDGETLTLYVDGVSVGSTTADDPATTSQDSISIGMNITPAASTDGVRVEEQDEFHHFSSTTGLEGLIDEVRIHNAALSPADVEAFYRAQEAGAQTPPALQPRRVPASIGVAESFGAALEPLPYHDLWDDMWRVEEGDDVLVKFDRMPGSVVYWRGTVHGVNMVPDAGRWMTDQSVELIIPDVDDVLTRTLSEHMSDKQARRSHVRVIENTEARVVVHWRYGIADVFDQSFHPQATVDEMHTIYPDGVLVRDVFYHLSDQGEGREAYQDFQVLLEPGQRAEEVVSLSAVHYANLKGETQSLVWPIDPETEPDIDPANIVRVDFTGNWDVYGIAQGGAHSPAGGGQEVSSYVTFDGEPFPFAGPWNHWPVAQIPSDGRYVTDYDRINHFALGALEPNAYGTGSMLYGMTQDPIEPLQMARSWLTPPDLQVTAGGTAQGYDTDTRAYALTATADTVELTIEASDERPVHNVALVVSDWNADTGRVTVVGQDGVEARTGVVRDRQGKRQLVAFLWVETSAPLNVVLNR
ncbi:MAG: LamG domain-containing protein [Myxococcota bacterium]